MAYAAITCLMRAIRQSMELTGCDLRPFYEKLESLRAILEKSCNIMGDLEALTSLEAEIAEVAYTTEDMVDSESRNVFLAQNQEERGRSMWELFFLSEQALECIDSTMKQWMATSDSMKDLKAQTYSLASLPEHAVERPENIMVGHETEFEMMLDQLTRGGRELEVVSIVGMGGIGKTTLATKLYSDPCIMSRFDIRAKVTVSQEYCVRNVLLGLLDSTSDERDDQLADRLQKRLKGRRYLVVIDDIWTTEAWDDIKLCFPDCNNGSRILLTTRNVEVAEYASSGKPPYHMRLMNFDESWNLLHKKIFEKESSSLEFEKIGKKIALKCGGLPLAITVIAGLLSKISKTLDEWQRIAKNVNLVVSTDLEAQCMRVLALSYHHLPSHLKPCFLYFAIFAEDEEIYVNKLVELWAVEGFLSEEEGKSIEEVAKTCINELIDRSLISIHNLSFDGKIESCGMHDVTRELCLREARNMNFVNVLRGKSDQNSCTRSVQCSFKSRSRISVVHNKEELARCGNSEAHSIIMLRRFQCVTLELSFKLVRVLDLSLTQCPCFPSGILSSIHLRYLALGFYPCLRQYRGSKEAVSSSLIDIPQSISSLCYLKTFKLYLPYNVRCEYPFLLPSEILTMPQLTKLCLGWNYLRNPKKSYTTENSLVSKNLQCLSGLNPRYCTGSFFRLFPNLKELRVFGIPEDFRNRKDLYDFRCLYQLEKLEFGIFYPFAVYFFNGITPQEPLRFLKEILLEETEFGGIGTPTGVPTLLLPPPDVFPQNLKNLTFNGNFFGAWKDLSIVGKLPKLEVLKLSNRAFGGEKWEVVEEGFPRLKFLLLDEVYIRYWRASSDHFPCLERLFLKDCFSLDSIPRDFADITTLALIDICKCQQSVGNSAKQIQQDIQDNYGSSIEVHTRDLLVFDSVTPSEDHDDEEEEEEEDDDL